MSTIVQIQVNVDDAKALSSLTNIENIIKRINNTPIKISSAGVDLPSGGNGSGAGFGGGGSSGAGVLRDVSNVATNLDTRLAKLSNSIISIHAPRMGRDLWIGQRLMRRKGFQSTRPVWGATNFAQTSCRRT